MRGKLAAFMLLLCVMAKAVSTIRGMFKSLHNLYE